MHNWLHIEESLDIDFLYMASFVNVLRYCGVLRHDYFYLHCDFHDIKMAQQYKAQTTIFLVWIAIQ